MQKNLNTETGEKSLALSTKPKVDHVFNPTSICTCTIEYCGVVSRIKYCTVHEQAFALLGALQKAHSKMICAMAVDHATGSKSGIKHDDCESARIIIAKAFGGSK